MLAAGDSQVTVAVTVLSPPGLYNCRVHRVTEMRGVVMYTMRRCRHLAGAGAALGLLASGCGSSSPHSSATNTKPQGPVAQAFAYARCMRAHGVASFPDPKVSTSAGGKSVAIRAVGANTPQFSAAQSACKGLLPGPAVANGSPAQQQAQTRALLAFARCLRTHGVPHFPDPDSHGQLTMQMLSAAGVDLHAPQVVPAARACVGVTHGAITMAQVQQAINHHS